MMWQPRSRLGWAVVVALTLATASWASRPAVAAPAAVVTDVRAGVHGQSTRFVLDLSDRVHFSIFTLADPYRVVIDLPEVGWRLPVRPLPQGKGLMQRLRYGLFKPGTSRVVIDAAGPVAVKDSFLVKAIDGRGVRLVVDLVPTTRTAFLGSVRGAETRTGATSAAAKAVPRPASFPFPRPLRKPQLFHTKRVIVIDPGHGGKDPGAIGRSGAYEKHITLTAAREIREAFERMGRYKVVLTRDRDVFIRLRDRIARARAAGADLFLSVHADTLPNKRVRGASVYTLSERASDSEAAALAEQENKADLIAGVDLSNETPEVTNILIDLAQRETMNESVKFAASLVRELKRETRLLRNTHRFAGFAVLKAPDVPSVLVELGFLSNREDERMLLRKGYRQKLASAIARAINAYFIGVEEAHRN